MKDIYVQFRGKYKVDGESRDTEHQGWLEVNSWSHNIRQPKSATSSSVGGHTAERVEHSGKHVQRVIPLMKYKLIFIAQMAISVSSIYKLN